MKKRASTPNSTEGTQNLERGDGPGARTIASAGGNNLSSTARLSATSVRDSSLELVVIAVITDLLHIGHRRHDADGSVPMPIKPPGNAPRAMNLTLPIPIASPWVVGREEEVQLLGGQV